jgi:hypothetical protein
MNISKLTAALLAWFQFISTAVKSAIYRAPRGSEFGVAEFGSAELGPRDGK